MKKLQTGNRILIPLFLIATCLFANETFGAGNGMDVTLRVQDKTTRTKTVTNLDKESADGSDQSTTTELKTEVCTLTVKVKSRGVQSGSCQLEWCFLSDRVKSIQDKGDTVVFDSGKKVLALEDGVYLNETIISAPFELKRVSSSSGDGDDSLTGDTYDGYIVLVTENGEILAQASNSSRYLKDEWIEKFWTGKN